jgi:hypothetical protein
MRSKGYAGPSDNSYLHSLGDSLSNFDIHPIQMSIQGKYRLTIMSREWVANHDQISVVTVCGPIKCAIVVSRVYYLAVRSG